MPNKTENSIVLLLVALAMACALLMGYLAPTVEQQETDYFKRVASTGSVANKQQINNLK